MIYLTVERIIQFERFNQVDRRQFDIYVYFSIFILSGPEEFISTINECKCRKMCVKKVSAANVWKPIKKISKNTIWIRVSRQVSMRFSSSLCISSFSSPQSYANASDYLWFIFFCCFCFGAKNLLECIDIYNTIYFSPLMFFWGANLVETTVQFCLQKWNWFA